MGFPARPASTPADVLAKRLAVSVAAVELARAVELVDLHIDTFIPKRLWGYDPLARHRGPLGRWYFGHLDLPRMDDGGVKGAMWSLTTNPFRTAASRWRVFGRNFARLTEMVHGSGGALRLVRDAAEYRAARAAGSHAVLASIQGGNAAQAAPREVHDLPGEIVRVTLVHLTSSALGESSCPLRLLSPVRGLTPLGVRFIEQLDERRMFVDLAHIHPRAFWRAVEVHDKGRPLIATHTGVSAVTPHWRNLDDRQIRAIADSGGVVGVIASSAFLRHGGREPDADAFVDHVDHVVRIGGEDAAAIGTDYDGAIVPPRDIADGTTYPVLVQRMLDRGFGEARVEKVLGRNFLRAFEMLRPGPGSTAGDADAPRPDPSWR